MGGPHSLGRYARWVPGLRRIAFAAVALLVAVVLVVVVTVVVTVRRPLPDWSGAVEVPGLSADVEVLRDARGVPQIYADTAGDLFYAQGYVHAQDRFFEMDLRRHITAGRLSELVGENVDALQADRVVRTLGWRRIAEQELPLLAPSTREYLEAYADGVNAYVGGRSPADLSAAYSVLDLAGDVPEIEPWTPVDSLAWLKAMAWDLRSNYDEELGRAIAYGRVGDVALVNTLYPPYPADTHLPIVPGDGPAGASLAGALRAQGDVAAADAAAATAPVTADPAAAADTLRAVRAGRSALESAQAALDAVPDLLGSGDGVGSNSWVVSGAHTESGRPLLANDPHLSPGMPSIWYQVGLHCTQVDDACPFEVAGFSFSGLPGVVIGHNADIAWGMTNLGPDVSDFFLEDVAEDTYLRDGQQEADRDPRGDDPGRGRQRRAADGALHRPRTDRLRRPGHPRRGGRAGAHPRTGTVQPRRGTRSRCPGPPSRPGGPQTRSSPSTRPPTGTSSVPRQSCSRCRRRTWCTPTPTATSATRRRGRSRSGVRGAASARPTAPGRVRAGARTGTGRATSRSATCRRCATPTRASSSPRTSR